MEAQGHAEFVTLAQAAASLAETGDKVHVSNLSRYLDRFPEIPSEKQGKFRFVHLRRLRRHRTENPGVAASAQAPELFESDEVEVELEPQAHGGALKRSHKPETDGFSAMGDANLRTKLLKIREQELDLAEREGTLVPAQEVQTLLNAVVQTFVGELQRQEATFGLAHGRPAASDFRKAVKTAQQAASDRLIGLAHKHLKGEAAENAASGVESSAETLSEPQPEAIAAE